MTTKSFDTHALANEFCRILNQWLSAEKLTEVIRRNATKQYAGACATHDFCDSNEAMAQAFQKVVGRECLLPCDEPAEEEIQAELDVMNAAWDIARAQQFKPFATYFVGDLVIAQKVDGGVRVLWDDEGNHKWGEFIAEADWVGHDCKEVRYVATNFEEIDPFYQRTMTQEVAQEAQQ